MSIYGLTVWVVVSGCRLIRYVVHEDFVKVHAV
jgi:hypothetical protein